jgi:hypothetical protein|tara:strand:+ start:277 stop:501 length:225 start_codon:yes stop_codon:yes gene_type:complete
MSVSDEPQAIWDSRVLAARTRRGEPIGAYFEDLAFAAHAYHADAPYTEPLKEGDWGYEFDDSGYYDTGWCLGGT